ncbi:hypothetical protein [Streptomyces sp. NPDC002516]
MHHRTFPAAVALATLALITGCSGGDTGNSSGIDGRQVPGASAGLGLPNSSEAATSEVPDGSTDQDQADPGDADPVDQCVAAILANPDGSVPHECEGLSSQQQDEVKDAVEINLGLQQKARDDARDLAG